MTDKKIPEKYARLMLDEPKIAEEVLRMGNIYYFFSWLDPKRHHVVFDPDGEMKNVIIPMTENTFPSFSNLLKAIRPNFPLLSDAVSLQTEYLRKSRLIYLDRNYGKIAEESFPLVRVTVFLKDLKGFIEAAVQGGFIAPKGNNEIKEYRAMVCDFNKASGMMFFEGVPDRGFERFCIDTGEVK